jgi:tyrosine-protein kinase Etk/Wzc
MNLGVNTDLPIGNADSLSRGMTLSEFLGILVESRWLIARIVLISLLGASLHIFIMAPTYRSDVLLQVDQEAIGISALEDFSDVSSFFEGAAVQTEIEIIKSRAVLGPVVDKLRLNVNARPMYFPLIGAAIARNSTSDGGIVDSWIDTLEGLGGAWSDLNNWLDLNKYAWGGEYIEVARFDVPDIRQDEVYTIVAGRAGHYTLLDSNGKLVGKGIVGEPQELGSGPEGQHVLLISKLKASPGIHFNCSVKPRLEAIGDLEQSITVTSLGYTNEKGEVPSSLIEVSLEGHDRERATEIVNEIADVYLRQNTSRKSAGAEKTLESLHEQLPKVKAELERAEALLVEYRAQQGSINLPLDTEAIISEIAVLEGDLTEAREAHQKLLGKFTPLFTARRDHVAALGAKIASLERQKKALQEQIEQKTKRLPEAEQEIVRLSRDVEVNQQLYALLLKKAHELDVVNAGTLGNVHVIDYAAIPSEPVGGSKPLVASVYLLWGLLLGTGFALARKFLFGVVEDPDVIETQLGLPVYAVVPHSTKQKKIVRKGPRRGRKHAVLSAKDVKDVAVESLRSLRTWLYFATLGSKNNVLLITGPGPGVGKSFLSVNFGAVLASAGKRTVVIDADLRKGHLHEYFGLPRQNGLSDAIAGDVDARQAIHETAIEGLFILPTGSLPPNPSELLLNERLASILGEISAEFDHVIIDSPPVLAVTDAAILGRLAGAALLVVKANTHPLREIEQTVKRLRQVDVDLKGVVFNDMMTSKYYGYGKYYGHTYSYSDKR